MDIITKVTKEAIKLLDGVRASYVIVLPDGERIVKGEINPPPPPKPEKRRRERMLPYGEMHAYLKEQLRDVEENGIAEVKCLPSVPIDRMQKSVTAYCSRFWGNQSFTTFRNRDKNVVEVMRFAMQKQADKPAQEV